MSTPESDMERALEQAREWVHRTYMPDSVRLICRALIACREPVEAQEYRGVPVCSECQEKVEDQQKYCHMCGKALKWTN